MSTKWNRLCKTCNTILSNDQEAKYHQQTYPYHKIESNKEAYDRSFKLLAFQFRNSFAPNNGKVSSTYSISSSLTSPSDELSSSIVFAPNSTVPLSEYKENNISFNNQRLIFISDDQESFEPLYGNSEHSDKHPEDDSNVNTDPITSLPSSKNSNIDPYNKSPPTTAASASYISHQYSQTNFRQSKHDQISGQMASHNQQSSSSGHMESESIRNTSTMPPSIPFFVSSQQQQYSMIQHHQNQLSLHIPPYLQPLQSFPPPNSYSTQPPQTAPYNIERTYLDDSYRMTKNHRRTSVDYSMYSGSSIHKERLSRKEYKNRFIGRSNRPRPLSQGDGGYSTRGSHHPAHFQNSLHSSLTHKQSYSSNNSENARGYSSSNAIFQKNVPYSLPTTADSEIHASGQGLPVYGQKPYYQPQNEQQQLLQMNEYSVPHLSIGSPYERSSFGSNSQGSIISTQHGSFGVPVSHTFKHGQSPDYNNTTSGQSFPYGLPSVGRLNSLALSSQRPSTASSSVSSIHNGIYFDNNPDSRKNSVCFPMKKESSYIVAENRELNAYYPPAHTNTSLSQLPLHHQEHKPQQHSTSVSLRTPNFNSPSYSSSSIANPLLPVLQQFPGSLPPLQQQRQQKFTPSKEKYVILSSPAPPQADGNLINKVRNPPNNNPREYRRY